MLASVALYGAGMVWNDIADRRVDARLRPERPLPSGHVSLPFALAFGALLLLAGIGLSPCRWHHGLIAVLVLTYDFSSKAVPWLGPLLMGTLRGLNLATALAFTDIGEGATATAILVAAVCYGLYIVAVTVLGIFEDTPSVSGRAVAAIQSAPPIVAVAGIYAAQGGFWPAPAVAAIPALWFLRRNSRRATWDQGAIRKSMMFLLLGTMIYTALLALAAEHYIAAGAIGVAIPVARRTNRWLAQLMT